MCRSGRCGRERYGGVAVRTDGEHTGSVLKRRIDKSHCRHKPASHTLTPARPMCPCYFLLAACSLPASFGFGPVRSCVAGPMFSPRLLFAFARQRPLFAGLWSQRNLCLPCVCRVVSPAFGVSKSTFVMPTHFQLRARSTRVVAARRVFAKLSRPRATNSAPLPYSGRALCAGSH